MQGIGLIWLWIGIIGEPLCIEPPGSISHGVSINFCIARSWRIFGHVFSGKCSDMVIHAAGYKIETAER